MERRLGKGLETLLQTPATEGNAQDIELGLISPNPFQPRRTMDPSGLEELRDSIRTHGILQPIVVRRRGDAYQLVSGERRWRAARLAGLSRIPATVRSQVSDHDMLELALVENIHRRDLNPLERAEAFKNLMDQLGLTQEAVAAKVGLKRATVANHLRLLELPDDARQAVAKGLISMGHARALLGLSNTARMGPLLQEIVQDGLSVRAVEARVRHQLDGSRPDERLEAEAAPAWIAAVEQRLRNALATKVTIHATNARRGAITVFFYSSSDLDRVLDRIAPQLTVG